MSVRPFLFFPAAFLFTGRPTERNPIGNLLLSLIAERLERGTWHARGVSFTRFGFRICLSFLCSPSETRLGIVFLYGVLSPGRKRNLLEPRLDVDRLSHGFRGLGSPNGSICFPLQFFLARYRIIKIYIYIYIYIYGIQYEDVARLTVRLFFSFEVSLFSWFLFFRLHRHWFEVSYRVCRHYTALLGSDDYVNINTFLPRW